MKCWFLKRAVGWGIILLLLVRGGLFAQEKSDLYQKLVSQPEFISVQKIDPHPFFSEAYEILVDQYLDHGNPAAGKFIQRIILSIYNPYSPVVLVTEGYDAKRSAVDSYINELSKIVEANQLVVEHRYFGKSMRETVNWDYLTVQNASMDLHRIYRIFGRLFNNNNKWIATGISKGGQMTLAYKAFFPDDMDIWIPYVAPNCFSVEDKRFDRFFQTVGKKVCREKIESFQKAVLSRRDSIQPLLDSLIAVRNYTFQLTPDAVLDYCVLEYAFSFWQWGYYCANIPPDTASYRALFEHLAEVCDPDYFSREETRPMQAFFVQAAREIGYYPYNTKILAPYLSVSNTKDYLAQIFLPEGLSYKFSPDVSKLIEKTVNRDGDHILLIYGENDPWTAASVKVSRGSEAVKMVIPNASHRVRIKNMTYAQQAKIYMLLETWLEED